MARQVLQPLRCTLRAKVGGARDHQQMLRVDAPRHQRRVAQLAHAHGQIDAVAHQIGKAILQAHFEDQRRMLALQ